MVPYWKRTQIMDLAHETSNIKEKRKNMNKRKNLAI
jgi:hypothetical protein